MMSQEDPTTESDATAPQLPLSNSVRLTILRRLLNDWHSELAGVPANEDVLGGYHPLPNDDGGDATRQREIRIHLGEYDDSMPDPQITITSVASTARNASGAYAIDPSGAGYVAKYDGRIDINVWTSQESARNTRYAGDPDLLAEALGAYVRYLVHEWATPGPLVDPENGAAVAEAIMPMSEPQIGADPESSLTRFRALIEVGYTTVENPPGRNP